jgi:hypothetical protein
MSKENQLASNFELNQIKLGIHTFQLVKGDRFETNGGYFNYVPCSPENKGKGKRSRWSGRSNNISAVKYKKDVLRADNIKLIKDEVTHTDSQGVEHRFQVWEVEYAYIVPKQELEKMLCLRITRDRFGDDKDWEYLTNELEVKRETKENYFLVQYEPVQCHSQILKSDMNIVRVHYNTHYVLCMMKDIHEMEAALFKAVEESQLSKIQSGHDIIKKETENLSKFQLLKSKQGY